MGDGGFVEMECDEGYGGYQMALYKKAELKKVVPLDKNGFQYVKSKYRKHKTTQQQQLGVQPVHKNIGKKKNKKQQAPRGVAAAAAAVAQPAAAAAAPLPIQQHPTKPKRVMSEKQLESLRIGRERRKQVLEEKKKSQGGSGGGEGLAPPLPIMV